ncbi:MAG TPA: citrate transporter [Xanthobacteraceae bacterium]|nr:citrate transporter [Xanthobacteraceae bacterium]HVY18844.1 citrate transporter [Bauldia sp.]
MAITGEGIFVLGVPLEFVLFAATLLGVAIFHHRTLLVSLTGLAAIIVYKLVFGFEEAAGPAGLGNHLVHEWVVLANLGLLLTGFAILSRHFEESRLPDLAPDFLPDGWIGGVVLLVLVFVFSGFLDNIASALIGATVARHVFNGRVHIAFLAAIVAAANAGGAGSVVGDTTTTMMWIAGKSPLDVLHGYVGAIIALAVFAVPAARVQQRHQPIQKHDTGGIAIEWGRIGIVVLILVAVIAANVVTNVVAPWVSDAFPVLGIAVWLAILIGALFRKTDFAVLREAGVGALFLLALVLCASLMPVSELPAASWETAFSLGFISSVFDNIPLTALALKQGGYDWGILAFAVGFGGSMVWFGSSAGVAVSNMFEEAKSVAAWLRAAWWLPAAYVLGFFVSLGVLGWRPL